MNRSSFVYENDRKFYVFGSLNSKVIDLKSKRKHINTISYELKAEELPKLTKISE